MENLWISHGIIATKELLLAHIDLDHLRTQADLTHDTFRVDGSGWCGGNDMKWPLGLTPFRIDGGQMGRWEHEGDDDQGADTSAVEGLTTGTGLHDQGDMALRWDAYVYMRSVFTQQSIGLAAPQQFGRSILLYMSRYQLISSFSNPGPFFPLFVSNFVSLWLPPYAVIEHLQQDKCRGRNVCHGHDSLVWHQNMLNPRCNVRDSKNISWKFMENMPMWMYTENIANILHEI